MLPTELDLTDPPTAGRQRIRFVVEDMRPKNDEGNFGYWRVSAPLVGWSERPALGRDDCE